MSMNLDDRLPLIKAPTLIVTTQESGLQTVEAVQQFAARIPDARVIVLDGDSYHIAAVDPETARATRSRSWRRCGAPVRLLRKEQHSPFVPAKAGTQGPASQSLKEDWARFRGGERREPWTGRLAHTGWAVRRIMPRCGS